MDEKEDGEAKTAQKTPKKGHKKLIKLSAIPANRWMPLRHIETIEQRNKPTQEEEIDVPFFLQFDNPLTRIGQLADGEVMEKQKGYKTKVIRENKKLEFMEDLSDEFLKILGGLEIPKGLGKQNKKLLRKAFDCLKTQTASKINYLLKQSLFDDAKNSTKLLMMFAVLFNSSSELDLKLLVFNSFLKVRIAKN